MRRHASLFDNAFAHGLGRGAGTRGDAKLGQNVGNVRFDGAVADAKGSSDFAGRLAPGDVLKDLDLAGRYAVLRWRRCRKKRTE
ncbi:MAG: hypothetical protein WD904_06785 [Dehalococcoidia bacterium]